MNGSKFAIGTMAVCTAVVASVSALNAETLTWTGRYSDIWDLTEKNWTNSVGEEVAFVNNSDALFNDDAERFTVLFTNRAVNAKQIIFDTTKTYTLTNNASHQYLYSATAIRKRGSGRLNFHPYTSILLHMVSEGVFVEEGTAAFSGQGALQYFRLNPEKTFFVGTNAVLHFETRNIFNSDMSEPVSVPIVVKDGTFKASDRNGQMKIGPLTFDNATFDYSGLRGYAGYGVMTFSGKLTFKGETPYELLQDRFLVTDDNANFRYFSLWSEPKTEFCVDDITGDAAQDVTIGTMLSDHCTNHSPKIVKIPGGLIKTGAGTLALTNMSNSFCGDIEVREGTLQAGPNLHYHAPAMVNDPSVHWLGCLTNEGRRITVKSGASLYLPNRNCLGQQLGITNLCKDINVKLVFDGGSFTNHPGQGFLLPDLEFSNGGSIAPGYGAAGYGRFMVKERFTVSGNVPFSWELSSDALTSSNTERMSQEALSLNGYPENIFEIADVTDDAAADATFGVPFMIASGYFRHDTATGNHFLDDWKFGFRKTGAGTMRITAPQIVRGNSANTNSLIACRSFNGDAKVEAGALQVDGDLSLSDTVRVSAGAYLSGTGLVNNVSIADGGGLRVPDGQTDVLRVGGNLAAGSGLRVDVILADGADVRNVRAKVLEVTGEIVGVQALAAASAFVDGVSVPNIRLRLDGNKVSLRYMRGTTVVLR